MRKSHSRVARISDGGIKHVMLAYKADRFGAVAPGWSFKPGYIYTQVRAISARINQNWDGWPSKELKKSYRSFIGKPVFVNHQNFDPEKARGKVVAARYVEAGDDRYIETVMEVDAQRFPKLAHEIKTGGLDSVSMGVEAGFTICSYCGNKAVDEPQFCDHVRFHKGHTLQRRTKTGSTEDVLVFERCYKLGFFELSYVFDPADETAVVSRVIAASTRRGAPAAQPPTDEIVEGQMPTFDMPAALMPNARRRVAYGEIEAPEDIDTLRDEDEDDTDDYKHYLKSPKELRAPNMDQTERLDREQEDEGLDADRRVEDVEDVSAPESVYRDDAALPRHSRRRPTNRGARAMSRRSSSVLVDPRTGRRFYAEDQDPSELIGEAEHELALADDEEHDDFSEEPGSDAGGTDDDYSDEGLDDDDEYDDEDDGFGDDEDDGFGDDEDDDLDDIIGHGSPDAAGDGDLFGGAPDPGHIARRRRALQGRKVAPMGLSTRHRVATRGRIRHHADSGNGYTDGGPYHVDDNDQGIQEDEFISQTPGHDALVAPRPGDPTISNSESNLVEAALRRRIKSRNHQLKRDLIAYEQITGRRVLAETSDAEDDEDRDDQDHDERHEARRRAPQRRRPVARRRYAESNLPNPGPESDIAAVRPDEYDPSLDSSGDNDVKGDSFSDIALSSEETQPQESSQGAPRDASVRVFRAFDNWLARTTGRTARQHGNSNFIRRSAARFCQASGVSVESLFPTLGTVLREARKSEQYRRANMRRRAESSDQNLDAAAPQGRTDVEAPVSDTTDALAQQSQFSQEDFGRNAGDGIADPDMSTDSQIWAPDETPAPNDSERNANRRANGITAVRYAEAYIAAGLAPNTPEQKWRIAGLAQTMRHGTIVDRIRLLDAVNSTRTSSARRTAKRGAVSRGSVPRGFGQRQLTASAANDASTDSALFFKG